MLPVAVIFATEFKFPEIKAFPWIERVVAGVLVPIPNLELTASKDAILPMFQAFTALGSEVEADVLKFKKLFPINIEPDPACNVPATCRFAAIVDVPVVVPTCKSPCGRMAEPVAETERNEFPSALCTSKMLADVPPPERKMAAVALVEVARTLNPAGEKGVDCPMETWSPAVRRRTAVPSSIQPDITPPAAAEAAQELSIKRKQPLVKARPLLNVEVAPEERLIEPPVIVNPDEVAKNPGAVRPVYNVEVAAWKLATPCIERMEPGVVVPMPTLPVLFIIILSSGPSILPSASVKNTIEPDSEPVVVAST